MSMLEFRHVSGTDRRFALKDVSFVLEKGYIMGLAGRNGAGKTTLMEYILDEKKRYTGAILLDGIDIRKDYHRTMNQIGLVSEENGFFRQMSVEENGKLLGAFYDKWDETLFFELLEQMKVESYKRISSLSRGELMKFQMAFAMAHKPALYLLDEATAGMDPIFRRDFFGLLLSIIEQEEASVLISTHSREELHKRTDYVGILENGAMISFGENYENREGFL